MNHDSGLESRCNPHIGSLLGEKIRLDGLLFIPKWGILLVTTDQDAASSERRIRQICIELNRNYIEKITIEYLYLLRFHF